jgi:hypothetical protein
MGLFDKITNGFNNLFVNRFFVMLTTSKVDMVGSLPIIVKKEYVAKSSQTGNTKFTQNVKDAFDVDYVIGAQIVKALKLMIIDTPELAVSLVTVQDAYLMDHHLPSAPVGPVIQNADGENKSSVPASPIHRASAELENIVMKNKRVWGIGVMDEGPEYILIMVADPDIRAQIGGIKGMQEIEGKAYYRGFPLKFHVGPIPEAK